MPPLLLTVLLSLRESPPPPDLVHDAPAHQEATPRPHLPPWTLRLHLGTGWAMPSEESRILAKDGYTLGIRWHLMADTSVLLMDQVGLGVWGGYAGNSWDGWFDESEGKSSRAAPIVQEVGVVGGQVPVYLLIRPQIAVTPRLGMARGRLSLHGDGDWHSTWTAGVEFSIMERVRRDSPVLLGAALGALWAPTEVGNGAFNYDMGSIYVSFVGGFGE